MADATPDPAAREAPPESTRQLLAERRRKLQRLRDECGIDPFGQRIDRLTPLADARDRYDPDADAAQTSDPADDRRPRVRVAGRIVQHRVMGNLIFVRLRDATGELQVAVSKKQVGPEAFKLAKLAELSDLAAAEGALGTTKTGEVTVWAEPTPTRDEPTDGPTDGATGGPTDQEARSAAGLTPPGFTIATKSLALPPGKWHGLQDPELRFRKRYVDLYANPDAMRLLQTRIRIIDEVRTYLRDRGYLEVETPMLQPIHGGAAARPFVTHHNALDMPLYLRIAPELYLKRLLVAGMPRVFELNRNFRNEGISPRHNPEFTMLEAYEAFGSWETMAELVEDMICTVAENVLGTLVLNREDAKGVKKTIDLRGDERKPRGQRWRRVSMVELVEENTGWRFDKRPLQDVRPELVQQLHHKRGGSDTLDAGATPSGNFESLSPAEQLVEVYEKLVEPALIDPVFVTHVPSVIIPLAKENADDPFFADVYELAINGTEISPGYTELNDPDVQARHFHEQVGEREEQQQVDEDFLEALRVGMPPAGGMGLGIDRLVMMLTGAESIRDVIAFPLMRPEQKRETQESTKAGD